VIFEGLVAIDPKNAYYYRALGVIYWRMKEGQKALKQFTYAIRVAPKDISSYVNRAEVYVSAGHYMKARKDLSYVLDHAGREEAALVSKSRAILSMIPR
jgi:regulator of sirC expression with transglutaminase-like and TPR domain